jgi:hypothetical protein
MTKSKLPIPIYKFALLQAYLYEIFIAEKRCEQNLNHTEWYLAKDFSEEKIEEIVKFFNNEGIQCDCDVINKLELKDFSEGILNTHR